jgi:hypothetical protein
VRYRPPLVTKLNEQVEREGAAETSIDAAS